MAWGLNPLGLSCSAVEGGLAGTGDGQDQAEGRGSRFGATRCKLEGESAQGLVAKGNLPLLTVFPL